MRSKWRVFSPTPGCTFLCTLLLVTIVSCNADEASKSDPVVKSESSGGQEAFFDPKYHDDGRDSPKESKTEDEPSETETDKEYEDHKTLESVQSSVTIIEPSVEISATNAQIQPQAHKEQDSKLSDSVNSPVIVQTGSVTEFHDNPVPVSSFSPTDSGFGESVNYDTATSSPSSGSGGQDHGHFANYIPNVGSHSAPEVIYTSGESSPQSQPQSHSSSPTLVAGVNLDTVKWPEDNFGEVNSKPQMYHYVEPVLDLNLKDYETGTPVHVSHADSYSASPPAPTSEAVSYGPPSSVPQESYGPPPGSESHSDSYSAPHLTQTHESYGPPTSVPQESYGPPHQTHTQESYSSQPNSPPVFSEYGPPHETYGVPPQTIPHETYGPPAQPQSVPHESYEPPIKTLSHSGSYESSPPKVHISPEISLQTYGRLVNTVHHMMPWNKPRRPRPPPRKLHFSPASTHDFGNSHSSFGGYTSEHETGSVSSDYGVPVFHHGSNPTSEYGPPVFGHSSGSPSSDNSHGSPSYPAGSPSNEHQSSGSPSSDYGYSPGTPSSDYGSSTYSSGGDTVSHSHSQPPSEYGVQEYSSGSPSTDYGPPASSYTAGTPSTHDYSDYSPSSGHTSAQPTEYGHSAGRPISSSYGAPTNTHTSSYSYTKTKTPFREYSHGPPPTSSSSSSSSSEYGIPSSSYSSSSSSSNGGYEDYSPPSSSYVYESPKPKYISGSTYTTGPSSTKSYSHSKRPSYYVVTSSGDTGSGSDSGYTNSGSGSGYRTRTRTPSTYTIITKSKSPKTRTYYYNKGSTYRYLPKAISTKSRGYPSVEYSPKGSPLSSFYSHGITLVSYSDDDDDFGFSTPVKSNYASDIYHPTYFRDTPTTTTTYRQVQVRKRRPKVIYGSIKSPGGVSDDFLFKLKTSYGTPDDLKNPSSQGFYRTNGGGWSRIPYMTPMKGYNYKYDTLRLNPPEEDAFGEEQHSDGLNVPNPSCENTPHCASSEQIHDIADNVDITRRKKKKNSLFKKLIENAVIKKRRPRFRRPRPHMHSKHPKNKRHCRGKRCRKHKKH